MAPPCSGRQTPAAPDTSKDKLSKGAPRPQMLRIIALRAPAGQPSLGASSMPFRLPAAMRAASDHCVKYPAAWQPRAAPFAAMSVPNMLAQWT